MHVILSDLGQSLFIASKIEVETTKWSCFVLLGNVIWEFGQLFLAGSIHSRQSGRRTEPNGEALQQPRGQAHYCLLPSKTRSDSDRTLIPIPLTPRARLNTSTSVRKSPLLERAQTVNRNACSQKASLSVLTVRVLSSGPSTALYDLEITRPRSALCQPRSCPILQYNP